MAEGIVHTEAHHTEFLKKTAENVEQATGQPTTPSSLNPNDESVLERAGTMVKELTHDASRVGPSLLDPDNESAKDGFAREKDEPAGMFKKRLIQVRDALKKAA